MDKKDSILGRVLRTPTGCWQWTGSRFVSGYGRLQYQGKTVRAHRLAYEAFVGSIPEGLLVCHTCDNRACVNPEHLFLGTHQENMADMARKGRQICGDPHPRAKLTREQVLEIRSLVGNGARQADVARRFGVTRQNIFHIVRGTSWRS